jgi:integrase
MGSVTRKIRESTGGAFRDARGRLFVRVTVAPRKRQAELAPWSPSLEAAIERGRVVQGWVNRLRAAKASEFIKTIVEYGARATPGEKLAEVAAKVDVLTAGSFDRIVEQPAKPGKDTFRDLGERWTSGELHRLHPDHVEEKAESSVESDEDRLRTYVYPHIKDVPLRSFTRAHADLVMANLPAVSKRTGRPLLPGSRRQVAQVISRVLNIAAVLGIIERSPLPQGWLPKGPDPDSLAKESLLPSEEAKLYVGRDAEGKVVVPLVFRIVYAFDHREGMRKGEAKAFDWTDVTLDKGICSLDENKTDRPRSWILSPGVLRMLRVWHEMQGKPKTGPAFVGITDAQWQGLANLYREHCKVVGIDRARLFERKIGRKLQLRAHDMRAFFITASMFEGRDMLWITDRSGHTSLSQLRRYQRDTRMWRELGETLVDVAAAIPEIVACCRESGSIRGSNSPSGATISKQIAALGVEGRSSHDCDRNAWMP